MEVMNALISAGLDISFLIPRELPLDLALWKSS
jgi:hypothetical protein